MDNNLFQQQQQFEEQNRLFREQHQRLWSDQQFRQQSLHSAMAPGMGDVEWAASNSRQAVSPNRARGGGSYRHRWSRWDGFMLAVWIGVAVYFLFFRNGGVTLPW